MKKIALIIAILVTSGLAVVLYVVDGDPDSPLGPGYVKVENYSLIGGPGDVACVAAAPECGVCFGEVIDQECWVNPDELDDFEKQVMGVD